MVSVVSAVGVTNVVGTDCLRESPRLNRVVPVVQFSLVLWVYVNNCTKKVPIALVFGYKMTQICDHNFVVVLRLAISLQMVCRWYELFHLRQRT